MIPIKLNFNYTDIFRAPRLALSGKKVSILIKGNLIGYISYFLSCVDFINFHRLVMISICFFLDFIDLH